jgi:hypothetical protein
LDVSFFLVKLDEEFAENVDAGEDIAKVTLHDESLVFGLETCGLRTHLIEIPALHVLIVLISTHVNFIVLFDED